MKKHLVILAAVTTLLTPRATAQDSLAQLLDVPIEKLLDMPIYSASRAAEPSFDAPLSSTVITKDQIKRAGCTSIPEALRLVPGVIVREQTNGNYDIHLRGLDNVPPNSNLLFFTSSTALVMIDNRPVYNYLHGGTFWETLPIALHDVEQIEVVRGPAASMYGPNAVSGVINIITHRQVDSGFHASAFGQYGSYNSLVSGASLGYKWREKLDITLSGNYSQRNRTQLEYYDIAKDAYLPLDSVTAIKNNPLHNTAEGYPHPERAYQAGGYNLFATYTPSSSTSISFCAGGQHSFAQKEFGTGLIYLTSALSDTRYADVKAKVHGLSFWLSHMQGTQEPVLGQRIWKWDLQTTDATLEYNFDKIKHLSIVPGIMYRKAIYDDSKYINAALREGLWSGQAVTETRAASLRLDYKTMKDKLRLIAAGRVDKFNYPGKEYFSYQLAATYKVNDNNLVRAVAARANRTPLLIDLFSNIDLTGPFPLTSPSQRYLIQIRGNKDIRLLTSDELEIGYRGKLNDNLAIDAQAYYIMTKDFSDVITKSGVFDTTGAISFTGLLQLDNINLRTRQTGLTVVLDYNIESWQIKPFLTVQKTWLLDYSPYKNTETAPILGFNTDPVHNNINSNKGTTIDHKGTPGWYGGAYVNYAINKKWNANVTGYFFGEQTQIESANLTYSQTGDGRGQQLIEPKLLLNGTVCFKPAPEVTLSLSFRNALNRTQVEFYKGDAPTYMLFGGLYFEL